MIELQQVSVHSGTFALDGIELSVAKGTYAVLMGRTGCGKTSLLEAICGLRPVPSGRIVLNEVDCTRAKPADRNVGYVPQDLALFPTMTVREHLEFALRLRRVSRQLMQDRIEELTSALDIAALLPRKPQGLSGGEAQRVALGRALSFRPSILLLDEPLNALDEATHGRLCELLSKIQRQWRLTVLHVTHRPVEALALAGQLFVMEQGRVTEQTFDSLKGTNEATAHAAAHGEGVASP